jgi:hypothetical protein
MSVSRDLRCIKYQIAHITLQSSKDKKGDFGAASLLIGPAFSQGRNRTFQASAWEVADRLGYRPLVPCHATTASSLPTDAAYGLHFQSAAVFDSRAA